MRFSKIVSYVVFNILCFSLLIVLNECSIYFLNYSSLIKQKTQKKLTHFQIQTSKLKIESLFFFLVNFIKHLPLPLYLHDPSKLSMPGRKETK